MSKFWNHVPEMDIWILMVLLPKKKGDYLFKIKTGTLLLRHVLGLWNVSMKEKATSCETWVYWTLENLRCSNGIYLFFWISISNSSMSESKFSLSIEKSCQHLVSKKEQLNEGLAHLPSFSSKYYSAHQRPIPLVGLCCDKDRTLCFGQTWCSHYFNNKAQYVKMSCKRFCSCTVRVHHAESGLVPTSTFRAYWHFNRELAYAELYDSSGMVLLIWAAWSEF